MSDRNPPKTPTVIAQGRIKDDMFAHVFDDVQNHLMRLGLMVHLGRLRKFEGKRVRIQIVQEPER